MEDTKQPETTEAKNAQSIRGDSTQGSTPASAGIANLHSARVPAKTEPTTNDPAAGVSPKVDAPSTEIDALQKRIAELEADRKRANELEIDYARERFISSSTQSPPAQELLRKLLPRSVKVDELQAAKAEVDRLLSDHAAFMKAEAAKRPDFGDISRDGGTTIAASLRTKTPSDRPLAAQGKRAH